MQRSKSFALLFLVVAFVAGVAFGFTADRLLSHGGHSRGQRPSRDRISKELNLTATQRAQFDSIMNVRRTQMRDVFKPIRPQMDSLQKIAKQLGDSTHEQLKRVLTPEQAKKLDEMRERGRKRAAEGRSRGPGDKDRSPRP
ncbi:MAG: hypothetical protein ABI681_06430 [Gemmatimonadales bacterium]